MILHFGHSQKQQILSPHSQLSFQLFTVDGTAAVSADYVTAELFQDLPVERLATARDHIERRQPRLVHGSSPDPSGNMRRMYKVDSRVLGIGQISGATTKGRPLLAD